MESFKRFFDETSSIWIKIYKVLIIVLFFATLLAGLILGITAISNRNALGAILYFIGTPIAAFFELVFNMITLNFLKNVQIIREEICFLNDKNEKIETPPYQNKQW